MDICKEGKRGKLGKRKKFYYVSFFPHFPSFPFFLLLLFIVLSFVSCSKKDTPKNINPERIHYPVVSGRFYPDQKDILSQQIDTFIDKADEFTPSGRVLGMMVPHAGYIYSGPVAGHAYRFLKKKKPKTIILLAPSHFVGMNGVSVLDKDYFSTPLGLVPIDTSLVKTLINAADWIQYNPALYEREHSLEVHVPFLQKSLKDFSIVPITMGNNSIGLAQALAEVLYAHLNDRDVFFIASSDMSHYYPYEKANAMDAYTLDLIRSLDSNTLFNDALTKKSELCGLGPVITIIELLKKFGGRKVDLLQYANSGDTAGTKEKVVGYGTVAFTLGDYLSLNDKKRLVGIARSTVDTYVKTGRVPEVDVDSPVLKADGAVFVTLKKNGVLRGCIGHLVARMPLFRSVQEMAVAASSKDRRFSPVGPEELSDIEVEVSVMTPMRIISDPGKIIVGRDGLLIRKGNYQGVLLPQVPVELGWTREQFLMQTSLKAGLPPDAWKNGSDLFTFQAIVFSEKDIEGL